MGRRAFSLALCGLTIAIALAPAGCGKGEDKKAPSGAAPPPVASPKKALHIAVSTTQSRESCPPLSVTLDGKPVDLPYGLAKNVYGTPSIILYGEPVECDAFMNAEITTYDLPHVSVGIGLHKKGRVAVASSRGGTALVNYVTRPEKVGDTMALCVPTPVEFVPLHPTMKGRLRLQGLIEGKHCGDVTSEE